MTIDDSLDNVASHRIADSLRTAILDGQLAPGIRIRQGDLADQFGASRIPVREALRMLHSDGLVTLVANSGAWVAKLTMAECIEAYQVRERVEPLLLRTSMPHLDDEAVDRLQSMVEAMEADDSVDFFMRTDRDFHLATYAGAPPSMLSDLIRRLWNTTQHYRRAYATLVRAPSIGVTHMEHHLLVDCIRRQDADDAERVLVMHIQRTRLELQKHPDIFR